MAASEFEAALIECAQIRIAFREPGSAVGRPYYATRLVVDRWRCNQSTNQLSFLPISSRLRPLYELPPTQSAPGLFERSNRWHNPSAAQTALLALST
jgi:hypothetical protein